MPKHKGSLFTKFSNILDHAVTLHRETVHALTQCLQEDEQDLLSTLSIYVFIIFKPAVNFHNLNGTSVITQWSSMCKSSQLEEFPWPYAISLLFLYFCYLYM